MPSLTTNCSVNQQTNNGFELLEARLQRLESVTLSLPEPLTRAARSEPDSAEANSATANSVCRSGLGSSPESETARGRGNGDAISKKLNGADRAQHQIAPSAKSAGSESDTLPSSAGCSAALGPVQVDPSRECQKELQVLVEETVNAAGQRMRSIASQMLSHFMEDAEKALQKSAGVIASQTIRLLEEEIRVATHHSFSVALAGIKSDAEGGRNEANYAKLEHQDGLGGASDRDIEKAQRALVAAVEAIQSQANTLLTNLDARLEATLRAFQENSAKQLATRPDETVREFVAREVAAGSGPSVRPAEAATAQQSDNAMSESTIPATLSPSNPLPVPAIACEEYEKEGKVASLLTRLSVRRAQTQREKQSSWRILGLN